MNNDVNMSEKEKRKQEDVKLMKDSGQWLRWPILPLVNREKRESAMLLATGEPVVYLENIWSLAELGVKNMADIQQKVKNVKFNNFEEIFDAGWEID